MDSNHRRPEPVDLQSTVIAAIRYTQIRRERLPTPKDNGDEPGSLAALGYQPTDVNGTSRGSRIPNLLIRSQML